MTESDSKKVDAKEVKVFEDLKKDVISQGLCCACGACVSYCESQAFDVIEMDENLKISKFKSDQTVDNCTECGVCYYICPQTSTLLTELDKIHQVEDENGHILDIMAAKTSDAEIEKVKQDGGIVSTIIGYLFDRHLIDAAIVSEYDEKQQTIPKLIYNKEDLVKSAGTRYSISSQLLPLKDLYNISLDIQAEKGIFDLESLRVAFVGTPCQCRAVSKMKILNVKPAHVIKYTISLFCFENFDYTKLYDILKAETKVDPVNVKKTWIKKNFFVLTKDDKTHEVPIKTVDPAVRNHCHKCDEFVGKYSDISVGASGAPPGYSMVLVRTKVGEKVISSAISNGLIDKFIVPADQPDWKIKKQNWLKKMLSFKTK